MAHYDHINSTPPAGVRSEAAKGLAWRDEYGRGGSVPDVSALKKVGSLGGSTGAALSDADDIIFDDDGVSIESLEPIEDEKKYAD
jgi:hypothetical protein